MGQAAKFEIPVPSGGNKLDGVFHKAEYLRVPYSFAGL